MAPPMSRVSKNRRTRQKERNQNGGPRMISSVQTPLLELQTQLWRTRAQAKQKWLEQSLSQPIRTPEEAASRMTWIKRALDLVKHGQAEIKYQAALMDAYTEHLSVLEMTLISAAEQKRSPEKQQTSVENGSNPRRDASTLSGRSIRGAITRRLGFICADRLDVYRVVLICRRFSSRAQPHTTPTARCATMKPSMSSRFGHPGRSDRPPWPRSYRKNIPEGDTP